MAASVSNLAFAETDNSKHSFQPLFFPSAFSSETYKKDVSSADLRNQLINVVFC